MSGTGPVGQRRRTRAFAVLALLSAIIAVVAVVYAAAQTQLPRSTATSLEPDQRPVAVIVGDESASTVGDGSSWPEKLAAEAGWRLIDFTQAGSGYLTIPTPDECGFVACTALFQGIPQVAALKPDIVLISAGARDLASDAAQLDGVIAATFGQYRLSFPETPIVVVTPFTSNDSDSADVVDLSARIVAAAETFGFITVPDVQQGLANDPALFDGDRLAPSGIARVESAVAAELRVRGLLP